MLVPLNWLKDYIKFDLPVEKLSNLLTMIGLEVEEIIHHKTSDYEDIVLSIKVTSNRGDCLSLLGIARELSAVLEKRLHYPKINIKEEKERIESLVNIEIKDADLCPRYTARIIKEVKITDSPQWLKRRLLSCGIRPINNIVDITNYVLWEMGQPLHAFDYEKIQNKKIIVRRAEEKEMIKTLDGVERELTSEMLVIADEKCAIALAGVMGGANTEVSADTKIVLLESAYFQPASIRNTSKKTGLSSESSYRFERRVDPNGVIVGLNRATSLMQSIAGGKVCAGVIDLPGEMSHAILGDEYRRLILPKIIELNPKRVNFLLGTKLSQKKIIDILKRIHLQVEVEEKKKVLKVSVPTYRGDLSAEIDLIEEIARIYGYNNIKETLPLGRITRGRQSKMMELEDLAKDILSACGFYEVITHSLISPVVFDKIGFPQDSPLRAVVSLKNPMSEESKVLRTTLIPGILEVIQRNFSRQNLSFAIFEIGRTYFPADSIDSENKVREKRSLILAATGSIYFNPWNIKHANRTADFYYLKGVMEILLNRIGIEDIEITPCLSTLGRQKENFPVYHPGKCGKIKVSEEEVGIIGEVHPEVRKSYDLGQAVFIGELDLEKLLPLYKDSPYYKPLAKFPRVDRDLALIVKDDVLQIDIIRMIKKAGKENLKNIELFDEYKGKPVPEGYKSLAFRLSFQSQDRTLTSEEVEKDLKEIKEILQSSLNVKMRE